MTDAIIVPSQNARESSNSTTNCEQETTFTISVTSEEEKEQLKMFERNVSTRKFVICFLGIFVFYFYFGILQEKITKGTYGSGAKGEKFTFITTLILCQCIINCLFSKAVRRYFVATNDATPSRMYAACSLSYMGAMLASNYALQHVNYPTQVLGKSVKPVPVMVLGVLFAQKRYPMVKYLCILLVVTGVAMFMYKDKVPAAATAMSESILGVGELLLILSLALDGVTGALQDRIRDSYPVQSYDLMYNMNKWSCLWLVCVCFHEIVPFFEFVQRHPTVFWDVFAFGLTSALGQNFIFMTVTNFGPLTCSVITTTRKFFTILGSVIIFQNPMSQRQWAGTVFVFLGLGLDSKYGKELKADKKK